MLLAVLNSSVLLQALVPNHLVARSRPCLCPVPTKPILLCHRLLRRVNAIVIVRITCIICCFMFQLARPLLMHLQPLLSPMRLGSSGETSATHVRLLMPLFNAATRTALLLVILSPAPIEGVGAGSWSRTRNSNLDVKLEARHIDFSIQKPVISPTNPSLWIVCYQAQLVSREGKCNHNLFDQ